MLASPVEGSEPYLKRMAERRAVDVSLLAFMGVKLPWMDEAAAAVKKELPMRKEDVTIGRFCGGACVQECTAMFGEALWIACRTCPD